MESTTTATAADLEDDEWELCNDDGFVYKRRKRCRLDPVTESASSPIWDPEADESQRRERKKNTLLKLKEQYQREIDQWEHLSNTLRAMEESTRQLQQRQQTMPSGSSPLPEVQSKESVLVDDLLLQVNGCFLTCCRVEKKSKMNEIAIWDISFESLEYRGYFEKSNELWLMRELGVQLS